MQSYHWKNSTTTTCKKQRTTNQVAIDNMVLHVSYQWLYQGESIPQSAMMDNVEMLVRCCRSLSRCHARRMSWRLELSIAAFFLILSWFFDMIRHVTYRPLLVTSPLFKVCIFGYNTVEVMRQHVSDCRFVSIGRNRNRITNIGKADSSYHLLEDLASQ